MQWLANAVTTLRIALVGAYASFLFYGNRDAALACALIAVVSDGIDGALARRLKTESKFGAFLDSFADALFVVVSWVLVWLLGIVALWISAVALLPRVISGASLLISRARGNIIFHHFNTASNKYI